MVKMACYEFTKHNSCWTGEYIALEIIPLRNILNFMLCDLLFGINESVPDNILMLVLFFKSSVDNVTVGQRVVEITINKRILTLPDRT